MVDNQEIKLESQIAEYFIKDNGVTTHFRYEDTEDGKVELSVYTFNKHTQTNFLFHKLVASSVVTVLSKMLKYIAEVMPTENNYIVFWNTKEDPETINESYFFGTDIEKVVAKFYEGKADKEGIEVTNVKKNSIG
ncbi:MAG: hypothetical protein SLAVMIC_00551 [uncultured marine phage]|uniref:Uncharacterized protein n=1 Tax=uncultured marine phage TaxID=707152 RepID=A0A8D9CEE1_9VIRU|nr:MAG: hypothetical protein SLAVMIC_00551 [uncultured marine phage]